MIPVLYLARFRKLFYNEYTKNSQLEAPMKIRLLEEKDNKAMAAIIRDILEANHLDIPGTAYFDPYLDDLSSYYSEHPDACYWIAVNEQDQILGGVGIAPFDREQRTCELQKLYVSPEARGLGVAKSLMNTALEFASAHYDHCYLETMEQLKAANSLYDRLGFTKRAEPLDGSEHGTMDTWYIKQL
jgi:putative acetyltransferase